MIAAIALGAALGLLGRWLVVRLTIRERLFGPLPHFGSNNAESAQ